MRNTENCVLSITPDTKARMKELAAINHTTMSQLVTRMIWEATIPPMKKAGDSNEQVH